MSGACIGAVSHLFPWGNLQLAFGVGIREDERIRETIAAALEEDFSITKRHRCVDSWTSGIGSKFLYTEISP